MPDWDRAYKLMGSFTVSLPEVEPGEVHDLQKLRGLVEECYRQRERCQTFLLKLQAAKAKAKRDAVVLKETLKIAAMQAHTEPDIRRLPNKAARERAVSELLMSEHQSLILKQATLQEFETAVDCCQMQLSGLETAKQQINTLVRLTLAELELEN
jgi:hypothetical protein